MTERGSQPADPIGDFQRWLMRSGARGLSSQLKGQFRRAVGGSSQGRVDVWDAATSEPPSEPPECAWCPVCRAARRMRDRGPGLASQMAGAGDALFSMAQDTISAVESTLAGRPGEPAAQARGNHERRDGQWPAVTAEGTGWPGEDPPAGPPGRGSGAAR